MKNFNINCDGCENARGEKEKKIDGGNNSKEGVNMK